MKSVLVTGFEPFGGDTVNPSGDIARALHGAVIQDWAVVGCVLPCEFAAGRRALDRALRQTRPGWVFALGLASSRTEITPERVAINVMDARIPDNAGAQPVDEPVLPRGPAAYWSTLPVKSLVAGLRADGFPAAVSQTAGTYVCNASFYWLMHRLRRRPGVRGGFIHVPPLAPPPGEATSGWALERLVAGIRRSIELALQEPTTPVEPGGAID